MAIRDLIEEDNKLHLVIDNGDVDKLDQALNKWSFKDYQSLIRFSVSILLLAEDKSISIKMNGIQTNIQPAPELLIEEAQDG
jgi:hypothetical protein